MKFILKSVMALGVLTASLTAVAATTHDDTARYLEAMQSMDPKMTAIMSDIVQLQAQCGHTVTVEELKTLATNDDHYSDVLRDVTLKDGYLHSRTYRQQMNQYYGECH